MLELRYNPYQIFTNSKSPVGLYARKKWLDQGETLQWKTDFQETVTALFADQSDDGSWRQSDLETIIRLFGLHLTARESSPGVEAALNWLSDRIDIQSVDICSASESDIIKEKLEGLPFIQSRRDLFLTGATLFLASIFGRDKEPSVIELYRWLSRKGQENNGLWFDRACSHNIFRAMVVHPVYSKDSATVLAVQTLAKMQSRSGEWKDLPFYQTVNALAHLDLKEAENQLDKAFSRLGKTQHPDGSWSETEAEWNTFLAVHAMRNKGL